MLAHSKMVNLPEGVRRKGRILRFLMLCCMVWVLAASASVSNEPSQVLHLVIRGTINPAVSDYISAGMDQAQVLPASLVVIEMDTPGGLDRSMRDIIQAILGSPIPVATYVSPEGARAASAGTYILYASHVAAMSPATNLGAATPVQIGGMPGTSPQDEEKKKEDGKDGAPSKTAMERKIINDASAYIRALADRHGRNAEWAVKAVHESVSISAREALDLNVIDLIAVDLEDLLQQLDGHQVKMFGETRILTTSDAQVVHREPDWRYRLLSVISDPTVAYMLLLLGFYGLFFELANPGFMLPGVAGGIALLLALYAFQVLPVNYAGLALIVLGLIFLISEAFIPSFGALGIGGVVAFAIGSLILFDDEYLKIPLTMVIGTTVVSAGFVLLLVGRVASLRKRKVHTGTEAMLNMTGEARSDFIGSGKVWVAGESWIAHCPVQVKKGEKVKITAVDGLELTVEPLAEES